MRKTRKYPFMFGSVRRKKEIRNRPVFLGPECVRLDCVECVSEPICTNFNVD